MTPSDKPRLKLRWIWIALPLSMLLTLGLIVVGLIGFVRLGPDGRCLRDSLLLSAAAQTIQCQKKIELSAGGLTFDLLRAGLSFAPLPADARTAVQALRGAELGVYHIPGGMGCLDRAALLTAADQAMARRGWERMVGVAKEQELVAVYVPTTQSASGLMHACVAVFSRTELIVVSARTDLEPLMELALTRSEWPSGSWKPAPL
jgi:hypothetical protein